MEILNKDKEFAEPLIAAMEKLPTQIDKHGHLQERMQDWNNPEDHHGHVSHLI